MLSSAAMPHQRVGWMSKPRKYLLSQRRREFFPGLRASSAQNGATSDDELFFVGDPEELIAQARRVARGQNVVDWSGAYAYGFGGANRQALWRQVVILAVDDLRLYPAGSRAWSEARHWLESDSHDLTTVCDLAGLDAAAINDIARAMPRPPASEHNLYCVTTGQRFLTEVEASVYCDEHTEDVKWAARHGRPTKRHGLRFRYLRSLRSRTRVKAGSNNEANGGEAACAQKT